MTNSPTFLIVGSTRWESEEPSRLRCSQWMGQSHLQPAAWHYAAFKVALSTRISSRPMLNCCKSLTRRRHPVQMDRKIHRAHLRDPTMKINDVDTGVVVRQSVRVAKRQSQPVRQYHPIGDSMSDHHQRLFRMAGDQSVEHRDQPIADLS